MKTLRIGLLSIILCWSLGGLLATAVNAESDWHYPLEIKVGVSSGFGEFRGNRVHTGVDLRTNMQTGYKVFAIKSGTIVRLCVKKLGFGNALYIEHPDGKMSVYGHLDRFEEEQLGLRSLVRQYQTQRGTKYPGNIYLKEAVKKGQLIGYSGETGYGLPHLHFELRQGGATPINPFQHGFEYADDTPPVIKSLILHPLGSHSFVDGEHFAREYPAEARESGKYRFAHSPRVHGTLRFTLGAYDEIGAANKCNVDRIDLYIAYAGVDKLDVYVDEEKFFSNQFNWVTYNSNHRGGLVYDYTSTRLSNPTQYYYRLYNLSPDHFPYREVFAHNNGVWDTSQAKEGWHVIRIEARDPNGNLSEAQMQVYVEHQPTFNSLAHLISASDAPRLTVFDFHDFLEIVLQAVDAPATLPTAIVTQAGSSPVTLTLEPKGQGRFSAAYDLIPGSDGMLKVEVQAESQSGQPLTMQWQMPVTTIFARRGGTVSYQDTAFMTFPAGALYHDVFANIFPTHAYNVTDGLPVIGEIYDFRPAGVPLEIRGSIRIRYPRDTADPQQLGLYWWDDIKERWYFMDDNLNTSTRSLSAKIIYPSIYGILRDTVRPEISELTPSAGASVEGSLPWLSARIKDVGKGVAESTIVMELDGKRVEIEYDPDRYTVKHILSAPLKPGQHTLTVRAKDRAGHAAKTRTVTFTVQ